MSDSQSSFAQLVNFVHVQVTLIFSSASALKNQSSFAQLDSFMHVQEPVYFLIQLIVNSLPNKKNLDWFKLTDFSDHKIKCDSNTEICSRKSRKTLWGKRRKCWLPAFSPFPRMSSKDFFLRVVISWDCVVKR